MFGTLLFGKSRARSVPSATELLAFRFDFDSNPEVSDFMVYFGTEPGNYTRQAAATLERNAGVVAVRGLDRGQTYFFAVTARAKDGTESDYSNEARYTVPE